MKGRTLLLFLTLLLAACQQEKEMPEPTPQGPAGPQLWPNILAEESDNRQNLYNSGVQGNILTVMGKYSRVQVLDDGTVGKVEIWPVSRTVERHNAISPSFLTSSHTLQDGKALFIYHYSTTVADNHFFLQLPGHAALPGSLFAGFNDFNFGEEDAAINDDGVVLLPLRSQNQPNRPALVQFTLEDPGQGAIPGRVTMDTASFREILLPATSAAPAFIRLQTIEDDFYVSTTAGSYRILPDGSFEEVYGEPVLEFFVFQEDIYGYLGQGLIRSTDGGATWSEVPTGWDASSRRRFFTVADQLFCYEQNRLFRVDSQGFTISRIHEEQLEGRNIRSVSVFAGHLYFATDQGLLRVSTSDFLSFE